jgi:hypothetical protein
MFSPQTDPLGIGLMAKAREQRFRATAAGQTSPIGPLPDPQWEGFFQAVHDAVPAGKEVKFGMDNPTVDETYNDPEQFGRQERALGHLGPAPMHLMGQSRQLGTISGAALDSLRRLRKGQL